MQTLLELGERRRRDVRDLLDHSVRLDPRFCRHLIGGDVLPGAVESALRTRDAPATCYIVAANSDLDGREMSLGEALAAVIGMGGGAFVSCIPGRLAVYQYGEMKSSYLLAR